MTKKKNNKNAQAVQKREQELKVFYTKKFTHQLKKIMAVFKEKEEKQFYTQIYKDLNISKTAFHNYTTDRLPKRIETIFLIKEYFDVPFSYLFGEISSLEQADLNATLNYGLSDKALEKLKKLVKNLKTEDLNGETKKSITARQKLIFIETFIENDKLLNLISDYFDYSLLEKKNIEKLSFLKLEIYRELINSIDNVILDINKE